MGEAMIATPAAGEAAGQEERPAPPRPPAEPATARALWPTFMRRTLDEEMLRAERPARLRG